jgi:CxxC motif-containing protein (DUF1111 family)
MPSYPRVSHASAATARQPWPVPASPRARVLLALLALLPLPACEALGPEAPADTEVLDGPIVDLTTEQLRLHVLGDEEFGRRFGASDGLGPVFVATSCDQCHVGDGKGHPAFALTRFGRVTSDGFDPLTEYGGPQLQNRAVAGHMAETVPPVATGVAVFLPPAVTGLGYLDEVDDSTLLRLADPDDLDGDGISGRVQRIQPSELVQAVFGLEGAFEAPPGTHGTQVDGAYIGRFGKKASTVNLLHQTVGAYHQDMGITSDLLPEDLFNPAQGSRTSDVAPDPEVSSATVSNVVFYLKTLRVPERRDRHDPDVQTGELAFVEAGCAACHLPTLRTGRSDIAALDQVEFHPYTDLLLHDMGPELDDLYTEGAASTSEWRTPPLWGIGLQANLQGGQALYLHDGRASTLRDAIALHGGEAAASRSRFEALAPDRQEQLLRFLLSL